MQLVCHGHSSVPVVSLEMASFHSILSPVFFSLPGKDRIIFVTKEDHEAPSNAELIADDPNDPYEDQGQWAVDSVNSCWGMWKDYETLISSVVITKIPKRCILKNDEGSQLQPYQYIIISLFL